MGKQVTGKFKTRGKLEVFVFDKKYKEDLTGEEIARLAGVSPATVSRILYGRNENR